MAIRIGKTAPEFETKGYLPGEIKGVSLADYHGKWVMLYFYCAGISPSSDPRN